MQFSKQRDELFNRKACLANDRAQGAAIEFLVIGNGGLAGRRLAHNHDVAATLPIDFESDQSAFTQSAPEMTGSLLTQRPRPTRGDPREAARRARAKLPRRMRLPAPRVRKPLR